MKVHLRSFSSLPLILSSFTHYCTDAGTCIAIILSTYIGADQILPVASHFFVQTMNPLYFLKQNSFVFICYCINGFVGV